MKITIENLQKKIRINHARILRAVKKTFLYKKVEGATLSVVFVTDQRIKALNKKYLKREYTTDVLSFDLRENLKVTKNVEGEIIISTDTAKRNARIFGTSVNREIVLYVVHGILHLLGFDDHTPGQIKRMRGEERKILNLLENPPARKKT